MITYDELKTALTDISNICRMSDCDKCPMNIVRNNWYDCILCCHTPNIWLDNINTTSMEQFAARGAHLVEEGYIDE